MGIKAINIVDTSTYGKEPKEAYKSVFEEIGQHIINSAERLSSNIVDNHAGLRLEFDIPIDGIVTMKSTNIEYVMKKELEEE